MSAGKKGIRSMKKSIIVKILLGIGIVVGLLVVIVLSYLAYVFLTYSRIEDNQVLDVQRESTIEAATTDATYTITTFNMGFGAYTDDYTFFMDGGKESRARSEESVKTSITENVNAILSMNPDFVLFQEVDTDSTRSYHINENEMISSLLNGFDSTFAVNYHSAYLMYPILEPHGASNSGIDTLSKMQITSGLRRKLEISTGFSKVIDLDRCYSISRVAIDNGKELVLFNVHLSAYGASDNIKENQIQMLMGDMKKEYDAGNYVICGGDFNADFTGTSVTALNGPGQEAFGWTMPFPDELIPEGIIKCVDYSCKEQKQTVRNNDIPYKEGNFVAIVDGFFVSDNVEVEYLENVQLHFKYSDHNPVCMRFLLK